ncbi:MAG: nucleotidyltransferase [Syntrophotaleaceae bacterium]
MRAVGLITEYNPFHNGHLHHLRESKKIAGADVAVAVMSGHFLQRGEPALVDKWRRTAMALGAGVDLVLELPFAFACQSAPYFAKGAVQCLEALGGVDALCFGSEAGDLPSLQQAAAMIAGRQPELRQGTAARLRKGVSYPAARADLMAEWTGNSAADSLLGSPNNILGLEYLHVLTNIGSPIKPLTIRRLGPGYHDPEASGEIASATGIRRMLAEGRPVRAFLPEGSGALLQEAMAAGQVVDFDLLHRLVLNQIFRGRDALKNIYQVEQGLDRRLVDAAVESSGWEDLLDRLKVRQLTRTRIQRVLCYVLNDVSGQIMQECIEAGPRYLRLLGAGEQGRRFLAATREKRSLPILDNLSRVPAILKRFFGADTHFFRLASQMLELDLRATRNYTLMLRGWQGGNRNLDFFREVLSV